MFAFVVFDLVFQYYAKILAGKNVSKMTYLCRVGCKTLTQSINQYLWNDGCLCSYSLIYQAKFFWYHWQNIEFGCLAASRDAALQWLTNEMQQVSGLVKQSTLLPSLSHHGNCWRLLFCFKFDLSKSLTEYDVLILFECTDGKDDSISKSWELTTTCITCNCLCNKYSLFFYIGTINVTRN